MSGAEIDDEQDKLLEEAQATVKHQAFLMKRARDNDNLMDALKHASNMIFELRTSVLGPKKYFSLFMQVQDELFQLRDFFRQQHKNGGKSLVELYELVQHAGNILPRLYLLVTVGAVYIESQEAPARDVLKDLAEMCRGVQHATRGLFLRHYLSQATKTLLPDKDNAYDGEGGDVRDSIDFIISNFNEMNKLWVRMQHQASRDKEKRERERQELRVLVGTNLVRLRDLDGLTEELYSQVVLPKVLEQIVNCKDQIAQQYLMDCLIQAIPDSFHLLTLESLLSACAQLHDNVNVTSIVMSLLDRLRNYAVSSKDLIPEDIKVFDTFTTHIAKIITARPGMQLVDILQIQLSLLNFALKCYPGNLAYIDQVLEFCAHTLHRMSQQGKQKLENPACVRLVVQLLTALLDLDDAKNQVLVILEFDNYPELMQYLHVNTRKTVAMAIVQSVLKHQTTLEDHDKIAKLFEFLRPLVKDDPEAVAEDTDKEDFEEEQHLVARLVHLFQHRDTDELFRIFATVRKHFGQGGAQRIAHTLPPLVFRCLMLARRVRAREQNAEDLSVTCKKVFQFSHEMVTALAPEYPEVALRLFLQCAEAADRCGLETICYEFVTQAFILYEDEIAASKAQFGAMNLMIGSIQTLTSFTEDNYENLVTKASLYSAKLLKKPDQCRAVYMCSHLFWSPSENGYRNGKRVLECLQKSLKIADTCMAASLNVLLFVEILNQYIYYFSMRNEMVTQKYLSSLIDLINTNMATMDSSDANRAIMALFKNTCAFIQGKKETEGERYRDIEVNQAN